MPQSKDKPNDLERENALLRSQRESLQVIQAEKDALQEIYAQSQTRFKTIFEESSLGKKIIDEKLNIIQVNKMLLKILGYDEAELIGRQITEFSPPDHVSKWEKLRKELWLSSDPRTSFSIDTCLVRKDKSIITCHVTSIVFLDNGVRLGYTIVEDITDRIEAERLKKELEDKEHLLELKANEQKRHKELFETIIRTQEEERERIAEQLHNSLGQMLYAVKIKLSQIRLTPGEQQENIATLSEANTLLSDSISECRRTAHHLLPRILNDFGLRDAIEDLSRQFNSTVKFKVDFESLAPIKEKYVEIVIFRIVQELFLNIVKHAAATEANCIVRIDKKAMTIVVHDNGKGLEPGALKKNGIGLSAMKSRVKHMEGTFDISSQAQKGTTVTITLPRRKF